MAKKAYISVPNFVPRELPEGYTQVEYIESSGTQYIDTGIMPNTNTSISVDFKMESSAASQFVYGCRTSSYTNNFILLISSANSSFRSGFGSELLSFSISDLTSKYKAFHSKEKCQIGTNELVHSGADFTSTLPIYLFCANEDGTAKYFSSMKLYTCKIYDGENLVRDYVPCKNGDVIGLYDIANDTFYENAGTGTFTMGTSEYTGIARKIKKGYISIENFTPRALPSGYIQVSYLESTGSQYIDTGFTPNQDTKLIMKVMATTTENAATSGGFVPYGSSDSSTGNAYECYTWNSNQEANYNGQRATLNTAIKDKELIITQDKNVFSLVASDGTTMSKTFTYNTFTAPRTMLLFATHRSTPLKGKQKIYSCQIYDNGILVRDYVPCTNSDGTAGMYDIVNSIFYQNIGTGAFTIGSSVQSVARKIKKAYISIGGVARPCWAGGELAYYGTITNLNLGRNLLAAATIGNYALFAGGYSSNYRGNVDAYDTSLVHTTPTELSQARSSLAATTVGNYVLFGGGDRSSNYSSTVDAYNTSLTRSSPSKSLYNMSCNLAAATIGNYALFAGGYGYLSGVYEDLPTVNAYDASLTRTLPTELSDARRFLAATTIGNYALFAGGESPTSNVVDAYDTSLTRTIPTTLNTSRGYLAGTTIGNYALFGGGDYSNVVDAYDTSLTHTTPTALSEKRKYLAATTVGDYALFGGGCVSSNTPSAIVDVYDTSLTRTVQIDLSKARYQLVATTIGDYALFGGGYTYSTESKSNIVDAYIVA